MTEYAELPPESPLKPRPRAVIIGGSSGIGAALARRLAVEGYFIAVLARREAALQQVCEQINTAAGETRARPYPHDVRQFDAVPPLFQKLLLDLKQIDLIVYAAGVQPKVGPREYDFSKDREMIAVNLLGAIAWLNQAAALFETMGRGQMVGISSVAGERGRVQNPAYQASKAGLTVYLESLRNRLTRKGVHVLTIRPGQVDTELLRGVERTMWVISPDQVAADIWRALQARKQDIYIPARWRLVMWVIRNIPSVIFRRLSF